MGVSLALGRFRLADHPAPARPAVERRIAEVLEAAGGLAGRGRLRLGLQELTAISATRRGSRARPNTKSTRSASHGPSAPRGRSRNRRARECEPPAIASESGRRCATFLDRSGASVDVRGPEVPPTMAAAEHIERQVAVAIIIAGRTGPPDDRAAGTIGGVEVERDLPGARACASRKRSTNKASIAAGSWLIFW